MATLFSKGDYFNPRSPHGERLILMRILSVLHRFQSTLPAWGATCIVDSDTRGKVISIHAPRMGSDQEKEGAC